MRLETEIEPLRWESLKMPGVKKEITLPLYWRRNYVCTTLLNTIRKLQLARPKGKNPEIEFLDINLTKNSIYLLHAVHSNFCWRIFKKTILFSGFKNPQNKKTRVYSWIAFCRTEKWGWKTRQKLKKTGVYAQKPRLKMLLKNSISA